MQQLSSFLRGPATRWWIIGIVLVTVIGVSSFGCWMSTRQLLASGLRIGFRNSPPFYYAASDGQPGGMAVDVLNEAARRLGTNLRWIQLGDQEASDAAIRAGRIDA
jgi:ABC-type amino acid transport substrate-binding protein